MAPLSVTKPAGFAAAGGHVGIKADGSADLMLLVADRAVPTAAVFTSNGAPAAPVTVSRDHVSDGSIRAVVVNSGCANAGTGAVGLETARRMAEVTAAAVGCAADEVIVCSTGPIGPTLPMDRVEEGIGRVAVGLSSGARSDQDAATGILTTDTTTKQSGHDGPGWTIGAIAKGAAMCRPDMATMLAFVTTDAVIDTAGADAALRAAVAGSFNSLNIDGCQSTNDTVVLMASGTSGIEPDHAEFTAALSLVCEDLARQMAADGEETTKVVDVVVEGAYDDAQAHGFGLAITDSDLVRSSFYGADPNWGRVLAALGASGYPMDQSSVAVAYEDVLIAETGAEVAYDRPALISRLGGDFTLTVKVGEGPGSARIIAADLTPGYVEFNGEPS